MARMDASGTGRAVHIAGIEHRSPETSGSGLRRKHSAHRERNGLPDMPYGHSGGGRDKETGRRRGRNHDLHHTHKCSHGHSRARHRSDCPAETRCGLHLRINDDTGQSIPSADNALLLRMASEIHLAENPQPAGPESRPRLLHMGGRPLPCHRGDSQGDSAQYNAGGPDTFHRSRIPGLLHFPVLGWPCPGRQVRHCQGRGRWAEGEPHYNLRPGTGTEEHGLRHLDGLHLPFTGNFHCGRIVQHLA